MAEKKVPFDQKKNKKPLKNKKQTNKARTTLKILILALLLLFLIASGAAAAMVFGYVNNAPPFDPARLIPPKTSLVYDYRDELVTLLHYEQNRTEIALNEIPRHVQEAFIAIEDERFHRHFGFDVIGIVRAAIANFQAGTVVQGASTITQQLVKNSFLSPEITTERKVQEIWLAVQTERRYSKDEILEMYLNWIYFGNGAYGVEAAAQTYFDKSASDLSLAEGAMLAAAIRSPNYYNPHDNETAAEERMKKVLSNMLRVGFISEAEYESALGEELLYAEPRGLGPFPHFIDYLVHTELIRILTAMPEVGTREEAYRLIYEEGLQVFTTLNPVLQAHVEDVLSRNELYPSTVYVNMDRAREMIAGLASDRDLTRAELQSLSLVDPDEGVPQPQAAMVIADPATGRIMALGGGREYLKGVDQLLRFTSLRQTGSAIKPIIAYAPALEEGVLAGASSALDDSPFIGPDGNWFPENFDFRFRGMVPLREALYISYNIPAVRAFQALGTRLGVRYAELMGISTIDPGEVDNLSLALGAFHHGVSAIDMTQAYSVLANSGVRVDLHVVRKIVDRDGETIYEHKSNPEQVLSPQTTFIINDIQQDFVRHYLGRNLQIDRPVAAKTGTSDGWNDAYLIAYTPNLVVSFWMGFDEPRMGAVRDGWRFSTAFMREILLKAFQNLEIKEFTMPPGIVQVSVCTKSGLLPNDACRQAGTVRSDFFIERHVPKVTCDLHISGFWPGTGTYRRPPYIITDKRWDAEGGGPGRGPEDATDLTSVMPPEGQPDQNNQAAPDTTTTPELVTVPDLVNVPRDTAEMRIWFAGLVAGFIDEQFDATVPAGTVIMQTPAAGTVVNRGTLVHIVVSRGPEQ